MLAPALSACITQNIHKALSIKQSSPQFGRQLSYTTVCLLYQPRMMVLLKSFLLLLVVYYSTFSYGESGRIRSAEQGRRVFRKYERELFL